MADAVTTTVVHSTTKSYVVHLTNISDGTGETNVIKVIKANLRSTDAIAPLALNIESVRWSIQGMTYVKLAWNHTTNDTALVLCSSGFEDFTCRDGIIRDFSRTAGLKDPQSAGGTGDLVLSTVGAVSTASYDITLVLSLSTT